MDRMVELTTGKIRITVPRKNVNLLYTIIYCLSHSRDESAIRCIEETIKNRTPNFTSIYSPETGKVIRYGDMTIIYWG